MKLAIITRVRNLEEALEQAEQDIKDLEDVVEKINSIFNVDIENAETKLDLINWEKIMEMNGYEATPEEDVVSDLEASATLMSEAAEGMTKASADLNKVLEQEREPTALELAEGLFTMNKEILEMCEGGWESLEQANSKCREFRMRLEYYTTFVFPVLRSKIRKEKESIPFYGQVIKRKRPTNKE